MSTHGAAWMTVELRDVVTIQSGGTPLRTVPEFWTAGTVPWVTTSEVDGSVITATAQHITKAGLNGSSAKLFPPGTVLVAMYGHGKTRGQAAILGTEAATNQACAALMPGPEIDSWFLFQYLIHSYASLRSLSNTAGQDNLSASIISRFHLPLPSLAEQRQIAEILRAWDDAIERLETLRASALRQRDWLRQNLLTGTTRLQDSKAWKLVPLREVLHEHGNRSTGTEPVYSVSVHKGLVNQIEHLGRSFAAKTTAHYNRVLPGDIVYTKSPTGEFPLGVMKQSTVEEAVLVSPLYGVFSPASYELGTILNAYFESPALTRRYLHPLVQKGAKNTIAITNRRFLEGALALPADIEEQKAIAHVLDDSALQLRTIEQERNLLVLQKRGLMQKLLTGEIRVTNRVSESLGEAAVV